ncbi:MAG: SRPBCC family protein [Actinomycetota bacterium]
MAPVSFTVEYRFDAPPGHVWDELVDWKGHERWIPATRVDVGPGEPTEVGTEFVATTGVGPVALPDRMRVASCEWDAKTLSGRCEVEKLGPVLTGRAGFTVSPSEAGRTDLVWFEDVQVRYAPALLGRALGRIGALGFRSAMKRLAAQLNESSAAPTPTA